MLVTAEGAEAVVELEVPAVVVGGQNVGCLAQKRQPGCGRVFRTRCET